MSTHLRYDRPTEIAGDEKHKVATLTFLNDGGIDCALIEMLADLTSQGHGRWRSGVRAGLRPHMIVTR